MRPEDRDAGCLWDMLDAARTVRDFTTGVGLDEYRADRKLQLAVERAIEIIGEAARLVSASFKEQHPEIPWQQIIAQRSESGLFSGHVGFRDNAMNPSRFVLRAAVGEFGCR